MRFNYPLNHRASLMWVLIIKGTAVCDRPSLRYPCTPEALSFVVPRVKQLYTSGVSSRFNSATDTGSNFTKTTAIYLCKHTRRILSLHLCTAGQSIRHRSASNELRRPLRTRLRSASLFIESSDPLLRQSTLAIVNFFYRFCLITGRCRYRC